MNLRVEEEQVPKTITRAMLTEAAASRTGLSRPDVSEIGERMFEMIGDALMAGETVKLSGFASLQVRSRAERTGRNPRTGEQYPISARHTVVMTPSARLREALDALDTPPVSQPENT
ncbi:integration host factor subunit alpha [Devosia sp. PTR5]|uniref:Integration host factor subunit alpha n=1 Tax=Devosia oryzisoli TaxID=2774138 RepID=A0A927FY60_9HYPH|nr:integration host factor subunit alpha [Devosia oryzisoli]